MKVTGTVSDYSNTFFHACNLDASLNLLKSFKEEGPSVPRKKDPK